MANFLIHAASVILLYLLLLIPLGVLGRGSFGRLFSAFFPLTFSRRRATIKEKKT